MTPSMALIFLAGSAAHAAPVLSTSGSCPGSVDVTIQGVSPGASVAVMAGSDVGSDSVPTGACAGADTGLGSPTLVKRVTDGDGDGMIVLSASPRTCDRYLSALDLSTCEASAAVPLDPGAGLYTGTVLWTDDIQAGSSPWGFDGISIQRPIGTDIVPDDLAGANLSVVADPAGVRGVALRHYGTFDAEGSRAQLGLWSFANPTFDAQVKSPEGIWVSQEMFFPEALSAGGDPFPWLSIWDWHSVSATERWPTCPGVMLAEDGSMRVQFAWGPLWDIQGSDELSSISIPVGEWVHLEMHYVWSEGPTTISLWINGDLALQQDVLLTRDPSHENVEMYTKWYGSDQGMTPWSPTPAVRYTRNVRFSDGRLGPP